MSLRSWWKEIRRWRHCPHERLQDIYGDQVFHTPGYRRLRCKDCGRALDGPVAISWSRPSPILGLSRQLVAAMEEEDRYGSLQLYTSKGPYEQLREAIRREDKEYQEAFDDSIIKAFGLSPEEARLVLGPREERN